MSSRSAARKVRPTPKAAHHKPAHKAAPKKGKKLAKVTRFPSHKVARKPPPPKKVSKKHGHSHSHAHSHSHSHSHSHEAHPQRNLPPLTAPKQVQQPKQSLARSFYWTELRVGDDLPPLTKPAVDRVQIVRYASAAGDFNRLHLDEPYAHQLGFPGLFAPGMLAMAFIGQLLTAWLRRGHVRKLSARFVKIVWPGDELTCRGRIAELRKEGGGAYADVELWAENQKGELVLRGQATCELYESPQAGGGDGGGLLFALQHTPSASPARKPSSAAKHRKRR